MAIRGTKSRFRGELWLSQISGQGTCHETHPSLAAEPNVSQEGASSQPQRFTLFRLFPFFFRLRLDIDVEPESLAATVSVAVAERVCDARESWPELLSARQPASMLVRLCLRIN